MTEEIHTIPVPEGWSPEIAWEHIQRGKLIPNITVPVSWVNIRVVDGKFVELVKGEEDDNEQYSPIE